MIRIRRWGVYLVDLNPRVGTKPGKLRPCVVIQDDALNDAGHPSTVVVPVTSQRADQSAFPLRVFLPHGEGGVERDSVILVDQLLAWDNLRFVHQLGMLSLEKQIELEEACRDFFGWS